MARRCETCGEIVGQTQSPHMVHRFIQDWGHPPRYSPTLRLEAILGQPPQLRLRIGVFHLFVCACCDRIASYSEKEMWEHLLTCYCKTCHNLLTFRGGCQDPRHEGMVNVILGQYPELLERVPALKMASQSALAETGLELEKMLM